MIVRKKRGERLYCIQEHSQKEEMRGGMCKKKKQVCVEKEELESITKRFEWGIL